MPSILQLTKVIIFYWVIGVMTYVVISIHVVHVLHCFFKHGCSRYMLLVFVGTSHIEEKFFVY